MAIKYRVIHTTYPWRKAQHSSLQKAIDGPDGAKNLLRNIGRVGQKWQKYGPVSCIFVWDENRDPGYAFRLKPGSNYEIEMATVARHLLEHHDREKSCPASEIEAYFSRPQHSHSATDQDTPSNTTKTESTGIVGEQLLAQTFFPDELPDDASHVEGLARSVLVNTYERSESARNICINHHKPICKVCTLNFEEKYGEIGRGYIHVHHIVPISAIGKQYQVDPINDLVPVCPNCHAMLHRRNPPLSIEELRIKLNDS